MAIVEANVRDVANALKLAKGDPENLDWGGAVFLVGAGCSASAGVPTGGAIAETWLVRLAKSLDSVGTALPTGADALKWLNDSKTWDPPVEDMGDAYGALFERAYRDPSQQREIIREAIKLAQGRINWAHLCLGQLVGSGYVNTVLTTNFDQLALEGIVRTGLLPVVADGIESLNRISDRPSHPQLVHLHGSMHTYSLRNSVRDVEEISQNAMAVSAITGLLREAKVFVVIGYSGRDRGVMTLLSQALKALPGKVVYWVDYHDDDSHLSPLARNLLTDAKNGAIVLKQDADAFFHEIMKSLGLGAPRWIVEPMDAALIEARRIALPPDGSDGALVDISERIDLYVKELEELRRHLIDWRERKTALQKALDASREARLAGRIKEAFESLKGVQDVPPQEWHAVANAAMKARDNLALGEPVDIAIAAYEEAIRGYRAKADWQRNESLSSGLADARLHLSSVFADCGRHPYALSAIREAVEIRRRLAQGNAARYEPELASSLNNLSNSLSEAGDEPGALSAIREAVEIRRRLAQGNAARYEPDLARSLSVMSDVWEASGDIGRAIETSEEAERLIGPYADAVSQGPNAKLRKIIGNDLRRLREKAKPRPSAASQRRPRKKK